MRMPCRVDRGTRPTLHGETPLSVMATRGQKETVPHLRLSCSCLLLSLCTGVTMSSSGKALLTRAVPLLLLLLASCGDSNVVPVTGTLTYKSQPVKNAYIDFVPANG